MAKKCEQINKLKEDAYKLESIGVGKKFGSNPKLPVLARIRREGERGFITLRRINSFHPSYCDELSSASQLFEATSDFDSS